MSGGRQREEGEEEPERGEGALVAGGKGMRRSEEARVSEEAVRRKGGGVAGQVRKPKCQRMEG